LRCSKKLLYNEYRLALMNSMNLETIR
jgi:hypothetical protein